MFKGIFKSIIAAAAAGMGIARVWSGFERNNGESLGHCVYGSEATGDFQKELKIHYALSQKKNYQINFISLRPKFLIS